MSDYCEYGTVVKIMFRISVSVTYELHDYWYYDALTSDKGHWNNLPPSNLEYSFSSNGMQVKGKGNNSDCKLKLDITFPSNFSVELTFSEVSGYTVKPQAEGLATESDSSKLYYMQLGGGYIYDSATYQNNDKVKFVAEGSDVSIYKNGTLKRTVSRNSTYSGFEIWSYASRTSRVKDLVIKKL